MKPLFRFRQFFLDRFDLLTLASLGLLILTLSYITAEIADLVRGFSLGLILPLTVLGLGVGWAGARVLRPIWLALPALVMVGIGVISGRVGQLGERGLVLGQAFLAWGMSLVQRQSNADTAWQNLQSTFAALGESLSILGQRVLVWLGGLVQGSPQFDPVVVTLIWSLGLWLVAAWAGWSFGRYRRPLVSLIPAGLVLIGALATTGSDAQAVLPFLAGLLFLMALVNYTQQERRWRMAHYPFPGRIRLDMALAVLLLAAFLLGTAASVPVLTLERLAEWGQGIFQGGDQGQSLVLSLGLDPPSHRQSPLERLRRGGLPRLHLIGTGPELARDIAMTISVMDPEGSPAQGYYWRSLTYYYYTGRGWDGGQTDISAYAPGEMIPGPDLPYQSVVQYEVHIADSFELGGLVYGPGRLLSLNRAGEIAWRRGSDQGQDLFGATIDINHKTYMAQALTPVYDETGLRAVRASYPDWVRQTYTQLPESLSDRVLALALTLTATEATPYDQAKAIETYLRRFPYTLDLPTPPPDVDLVDYFLFDLRRGYCDYYATSMVILTRAAGLPARLAVGYASGTYDAVRGEYIISKADAHSWAEVYFPEYGWIPFEPTAGLPPLERPEDGLPQALTPLAGPSDRVGIGARIRQIWQGWWWILPLGLTFLLSLGTVLMIWDGWRLRRQSPNQVLVLLYRRLYQQGIRQGIPVRAGNTPDEFTRTLSDYLEGWGYASARSARAALAQEDLFWLNQRYRLSIYSQHRLTRAEAEQVRQRWRRLRRELWLLWGYARMSGLKDRFRRGH